MELVKTPLLGMTLNELQAVSVNLGMPKFAAKQLASWLYEKRVKSFDEMTNISKQHRQLLTQHHIIGRDIPLEEHISVDGTRKYLFPIGEKYVETVYIPDKDRATVCVSSQIGCKMGCKFCATGKQGFEGNLSSQHILNQILSLPLFENVTNIVFMGQGEPMDNIDNVLKATEVLTSSYGLAMSPKRITVSSVGVKNNLKRFLDESNCHVAISLHTPFPEQRREIMPAENGISEIEIIALLKQYNFSAQRRLSFEYTLFGDFNTSKAHAKAVVEMLKGLDCRVNLIRYHKISGENFNEATEEEVNFFQQYLSNRGITTTVRASRGQDIWAACGLLSTAKKNKE